MSTTLIDHTQTPTPSTTGRRAALGRSTLTVGVLAAAATTAVAGAFHAAGGSLAVQGKEIPLLGFAQLTFIGAVLGGLILAGLNRWSSEPRRRFVQITTGLVAVSCIPSIAIPSAVATKVALVVTHLVAAAIVIPVLSRRAAH